MLIKLLAMSMVASSFFGFSSSLLIICIGLELASKPFSISDLVNENKATSAPEINAEQIKSIKRQVMLIINVKLVV